jgi:hypothetical protein
MRNSNQGEEPNQQNPLSQTITLKTEVLYNYVRMLFSIYSLLGFFLHAFLPYATLTIALTEKLREQPVVG